MKLVFICIGSNNVSGDCLGPLVGTYLKNKKIIDYDIYGDMLEPIIFEDINNKINEIDLKYNKDCIKVLIDSALGDEIGKIFISIGELNAGAGLYKNTKILGDINIKGVVGKNYNDRFKNLIELKSIDINVINKMAIEIANSIASVV